MSQPIRIGISLGDCNGVGYEVAVKALADEMMTEICTPVLFGSLKIVNKCRKDLNIENFSFTPVRSLDDVADGNVSVFDIPADLSCLVPGSPGKESGRLAVASLAKAVDALIAGDIDALVTAPISKEASNSDEFPFPGHTEYLESRAADGSKALMILFDDNMRIALATTHLPISKVAEAITKERIVSTVKRLDSSLRLDFSVRRPKIAVLALNPHAGDGGLLGSEEADVIIPAIEECRQNGVLAFGPFPADGFFSSASYLKYDGVVAAYHDQGLAPFKALAGERGVNFTAGLPFVRTSPDHGTAADIAWQGVADPTSMREAIFRAIDIFRSREMNAEAAADPLRAASTDKGDKGARKGKKSPLPPAPAANAEEQPSEAKAEPKAIEATSPETKASEANVSVEETPVEETPAQPAEAPANDTTSTENSSQS